MAAFGLLLAAPAVGHADDWLAVLPECAIAESSRPELTLLYPAPGLPAVVEAGQPLIVRVRTRAALTPPPGVQQADSLTRFMAELSAPAPAVGLGDALHQRHALPVISLRPDGVSSLVYRVRLQLPAYLAEGTYTLWLRTPFGTCEAQSAVRVIASGAAPRVRRLPEGMLLPPSAAASWPVDVWVAGDSPSSAAGSTAPDAGSPKIDAAPSLLAHGPALALRVGRELWVRSGCNDARAFERDVASVLAGEGLSRVELAAALARTHSPPSAAELLSGPGLALATERAELDNRSRALSSELSMLLPFGPGVQVDAGTIELFPASEPSAAAPRAKLVRWRVPAGVNAQLRLVAAERSGELELLPRGARSGQEAHLQVLGAGARARVAYVLGFARSAYGTRELRTSFPGPLAQPIQAQVFDEAGMGQVAHGHLWVEPYRPPNCAIGGLERRTAGWATCSAVAAAVLVWARRFAKKARALGRSE